MNSAQCAERENAAARFSKLQNLAQACDKAAELCRSKGYPSTAARHAGMAAEHRACAAILVARYGVGA